MSLDFLKGSANVVMVGPNGVGKSTLAKNLAHQVYEAGGWRLFARHLEAGSLVRGVA